jgi:hypothetical protein
MGVPPGGASGECPECPHWGSPLSPGIEPTGHVRAIFIAVPGAASTYRLYSVDRKEILDYPTATRNSLQTLFC